MFFERIAAHCGERRLDYLDGVVFGSGEMYLTSGEFCGDAPQISDYTWRRIYYRSIQQRARPGEALQNHIPAAVQPGTGQHGKVEQPVSTTVRIVQIVERAEWRSTGRHIVA